VGQLVEPPDVLMRPDIAARVMQIIRAPAK
jgi:hypothetical protein